MNETSNLTDRMVCDIYSFVLAYPQPGLEVSAWDLASELTSDDLAASLPVHLPSGLKEMEIPQVDADDFESLFSWFLS